MGKKVRRKSRASAKVVATQSPKKALESPIPTVESVDVGVPVAKETSSCPHLVKGINLNTLSSKIESTESVRCQDCREGAADRRAGKGKGKGNKQGKKKGGGPVDSKSESKAIWVCLECGQYTCGGVGLPTTPNCHVVRHVRQHRHPLVVHYEKPQLCWCFQCNMLIQVDKLEENEETGCVLSDVVKLFKGRSSQKSSADIKDVGVDGSVTSEIKAGVIVRNDLYGHGGYFVRGMINLGNTCFFNSIMQNLLAMGRLRDSFLNLDTPVGPLISSLKKLFTETNPESGLKTTINPRSFFGCVCSKSPQFRGYQQHDSHELLRCLLDGLSTEEQAARKQNGSLKRDDNPANTLVDDLFGGQISSTVRCIECGNSSTVYEPFLDLSLPVPTKKPPPRKVQQATRTKKAKLPPRKGGKARVKLNRDDDPVASQSISNQSSVHESTSCAQSNVSVAGEMAVPSDSGDSTVLGSKEISNVSKELSSPNFVAVGESHDMQVLDNDANKMSASSDDLAWLDYVEAGDDAEICEFLPPKEDAQDTEGRDEPLNELLAEGSCESNGPKCTPNEDQDQRPDSSTNGWEDEVPPQVQGSEVLLLPYKEESFSACEITGRDGEASCSNLGSGQEELSFDGFGDLFNEPEPEVFVGPAPRPSSSEVTETVFNSESDPDEVDDTDSPVSVESCLAHFIKPELLLDENGWNCENCSKIVRRQKREAKRKAKSVLDGIETGCRDEPLNEANSFSIEVRSLDNGNITDSKNIGSSVSHINRGTELENGQTNGLSSIVDGKDHVTSKMKDTLDEELQSSGCHNSSNAESCNHSAADASVTLDNTENVESRDPQMSGQDDDDSEECSEEEADAKCLKVKRDATKRVLIHKAPPVLTIHLKRFSQDARGRLSKLNGHVNFKDRMDLRPYVDPRYVGEEKYEYHLVGVVEHSGSMRGGHYVAYVRGGQRNRGKADNDENESSTWYHASDAYVREVSLDEVLRCEAYILFYEKI